MKRLFASALALVCLVAPASARHYHARHAHHHHTTRVFSIHHHHRIGHHRFGYRHSDGGSTEIHNMVTSVALQHGVSPAAAHAIVRVESNYSCHAHNRSAAGIMQTNYQTARSMGVGGSLNDCRTGLEAGMRYLKQAIAVHGNGCAAYSAYQSGIGVHRCSAYGRRIMSMMHHHRSTNDEYVVYRPTPSPFSIFGF